MKFTFKNPNSSSSFPAILASVKESDQLLATLASFPLPQPQPVPKPVPSVLTSVVTESSSLTTVTEFLSKPTAHGSCSVSESESATIFTESTTVQDQDTVDVATVLAIVDASSVPLVEALPSAPVSAHVESSVLTATNDTIPSLAHVSAPSPVESPSEEPTVSISATATATALIEANTHPADSAAQTVYPTLPSSAVETGRMGFFLAFSSSDDDRERNNNSCSKDPQNITIFSDRQGGEPEKVSFNSSRDDSLTCSSDTIAMKHTQILKEKVRL